MARRLREGLVHFCAISVRVCGVEQVSRRINNARSNTMASAAKMACEKQCSNRPYDYSDWACIAYDAASRRISVCSQH